MILSIHKDPHCRTSLRVLDKSGPGAKVLITLTEEEACRTLLVHGELYEAAKAVLVADDAEELDQQVIEDLRRAVHAAE